MATAAGLCAWVAVAAFMLVAVSAGITGPVRGSSAVPARVILARLSCPCAPVVLTLRGGDGDGDGGGAREASRGPEANGAVAVGGGGGEGADDGGDRDRQMRDAEVEGHRDQGRGEPCVDWRAYRPNTEAEQRRESKLAGKVAAACARAGATAAR